MFEIRFYNDIGEIIFGRNGWRLTEAEGLLLPEKTYHCAKYDGSDGQEVTGVSVNARTITLSGDIEIRENYEEQMEKALAALCRDGTIEIKTNRSARMAAARCVDFVQGEKKGCYRLFCIQFVCDNPYFDDCRSDEFPIFKVIPKLSGAFSFPGMFSERIARGDVVYEGSVAAEPVFCISTGDVSIGALCIKNHTTGNELKINSDSMVNEFITVDVKNRKIYNADGENMLNCLADDSFFDGFWLLPGINDIEVSTDIHSSGLVVDCICRRKYSEAMI